MMTILHGDCIEVMETMEPGSVDAIVTDPPYELGFMGKKWDGTGIAFDPATWEACLRVLKPGGYLLAFGGTRTFHRIAVAIEDAGFRLQDTLSWLHGQGFPKGKAQLKPGWEPVIMARKPGRAVLQIDACRIEGIGGRARIGEASQDNRYTEKGSTSFAATPGPRGGSPSGRWPANVILDETAAELLDEQSGERRSGGVPPRRKPFGGLTTGIFKGQDETSGVERSTGGASRFFYTAKASRTERNAGLDGMPERTKEGARPNSPDMTGKFPDHDHRAAGANHHPTVKPLALMRWLVRLASPPGGVVLDPFTGSGTTGAACVLEGFDFIGIEQDAEYVEIARKRIAHWTPKPEPQLALDLEVTA